MPSYLALAVLALVSAYILNTLRLWFYNIAKARASGLPYYIVPAAIFNPWWLMINRRAISYLRKLPFGQEWVEKLGPHQSWEHLYNSFDVNHDLDTYLTVSPGGIMVWTCDADVISQMTTRRNDFPKPTHIYRAVNIYGRNVVTTEGQAWRQHRKITSPPFTEKNNHLVWAESIHQAQSMIKSWMGTSSKGSPTLPSIANDTMRLSLHIISRAGFGVRLLWPGVESEPADQEMEKTRSDDGTIDASGLSAGHTMTYTEALSTLLHDTLIVIIVPRFFLRQASHSKVCNQC